MSELIPVERIENKIFLIRGQKVMLDRDLAELYGVKTYNLNKAVKRNIKRFPQDFMFQLSKDEYRSLRFQLGILERGRHSKYLPYAFSQEGVAMLSGVLNSERAIAVNIQIMRVFVRLRKILSAHKELAQKFAQLEHKVEKHDAEIQAIFDAIRKLMSPPEKSLRRIGFIARD